MSRYGISIVLAALFLTIAVPAGAAPSRARPVSFATFHDRLAGAGTWSHDRRWGDVWRPSVGPHFRPYFDRGHWAFTNEYGWTWAADDDWGDVVSHYGRWVYDPEGGWTWIPGYVWGPAWVDWRFGGGDVGWMPAPPDAAFIAGIGIGLAAADWNVSFYGYRNWYDGQVGPADLWFFVGGGHFADPGFQRFALPRAQAANLILRTRDVTEYRTNHGFVVNRSFGAKEIAHLAGHPIAAVHARTVLRGTVPMSSVNGGRAIAHREHVAHPVAISAARPVHVGTTHHVAVQTRHMTTAAGHVHVLTTRHVVHRHTAVAGHHVAVHRHLTSVHRAPRPAHAVRPVAPQHAAPRHAPPVHAAPALRMSAPPHASAPHGAPPKRSNPPH